MIAATFLPGNWCLYILPFFFIPMIALPTLYSYKIYKEHKDAGIEYAPMDSKSYKVGKTISLILVPIILVGVGILMFTGDVRCTLEETSLTVDSIYYESTTIAYEDITSVEFSEKMETGRRTFGFGSAKLSLGIFANDDLGSHTRYTYNSCKACIIIRSNQKTLVFNAKTVEDTQTLYNELLEKMKLKIFFPMLLVEIPDPLQKLQIEPFRTALRHIWPYRSTALADRNTQTVTNEFTRID